MTNESNSMEPINKVFLNTRIVILTVAGLVITIIIIWLVFFSEIPSYLFGQGHQFRGEFAKFILTIFGGLLVFVGLWLNYKRTKNLENQTKNQSDQIKAFVKQNDITEKGKVDERFKNAIEHLGNKNSAIILGGIYALHRIAEEDKLYRQTVFDILCSYIREKTAILKEWKEYSVNERTSIKPTIVIQTIIDLLFKIPNNQKYIYDGFKANLNGIRCINSNFNKAHLNGADLSEAHLERAIMTDCFMNHAILNGTSFYDAKLSNAHLEEAFLSNCLLKGANLYGIHLEGANMRGIHLEGAKLVEAYLRKTNLREAHMEGAILSKAHMEGALLNNAHLENAILCSTNLIRAKLSHAHLLGANLSEAHLECAILIETHLEGTCLNGTHLEGAILSLSYLEGAYLHETHLEGAILKKAHFESINSIKSNSLEYVNYLEDRIGKESEFSNVHTGQLDKIIANKIIENFSSSIYNAQSVSNLKKSLRKAQIKETNIEQDAIIGVLTKGRADGIIERYKIAMSNVPKIDKVLVD